MKIVSIDEQSVLREYGIRAGDDIVAVNGRKAIDFLDIDFVEYDDEIEFEIRGKGLIQIAKEEGQPLLVEVEPLKVRQCANDCVFCFVQQMASGLRRSLYINDEDYRLSFLYGNYITLTNLSRFDIERIIYLHLSPLFISVHAVSPLVRQKLIRPKGNDAFFRNFKALSDAGIKLNTQIVVCPGYNDNDELRKTLAFLQGFENVESIAVVPVGVTKFRSGLPQIKAFSKNDAERVIEIVEEARSCKANVFAADEIFLRAGVQIPPRKYYADFPQIENGIGLVRRFSDYFNRVKRYIALPRQRVKIITGESFAPVLDGLLKSIGIFDSVFSCKNEFFGKTVTVAGLLTATDVFKKADEIKEKNAVILVPDIIFSNSGEEALTLDNYRYSDFEQRGITVIGTDPRALFQFFKSSQF